MKEFNISGRFGPGVVVKRGNKTVINIAGGSSSGDVFVETSDTQLDPFDEARKVVASLSVSDEQKNELRTAISTVEVAVGKGTPDNIGLIDLILTGLKKDAPNLVPWIARGVIERSDSAAMRTLARQAMETPRH